MEMATNQERFRFGIEAEYLLADRETYAPLWHPDLSFEKLNSILESISLDGLSSLEGLELESPHRKLMPFVVEGYGVVDSDFKPLTLLPKGIEIRTPIANSIEECLGSLALLHQRLQERLGEADYVAVALSHHPVEHRFQGPQNKRRHDYWQWAMEVMVTYGPDINVSLPHSLTKSLDLTDLEAKVNYYAPALTAFSAASPLYRRGVWEIRGQVGKSIRTYRRSVVAPAMEAHLAEAGRLEFKTFEMSHRLEDFYNYFLLWLTLLLDPGLQGRASRQTRVYDLGAVARFGFGAETIFERAAEVLERAPRVLNAWGFRTETLDTLHRRLETRRTPADEILEIYYRKPSIPSLLRHLSQLTPLPASSSFLKKTSDKLLFTDPLNGVI